ncbi:ankyrin repeat-containing protein [Anaeramoeba flamelloides]|uniref:Ankyrin repeat-containing protein n=1 Tax=Anaeramoeba flamelloides TaxID=1746091 RepID=A0AAV7Z4V2_9EUKA|nr:ankyrin repeat-containing protein [Anaeramoeba flamelloides]
MDGITMLRFKHESKRKKFMNLFPKNVNSGNINQMHDPFKTQAIHFLLESKYPQLKDLEYLISLGSSIQHEGGSNKYQPLGILIEKPVPLRKDLIFCLFDHSPTQTILDSQFFKIRLGFYNLKIKQLFKQFVEFLKIILIYWFEKEKEKQKEEKKENEKEEEKNQKKKKKKQLYKKKYKTIDFILDCLNNKEDLTQFKESIQNQEIDLCFKDEKTNLNLVHTLLLSNRFDNFEQKLEILQRIIDHNKNNNRNKNQKILNEKINWIKFSELHLVSLLPTKGAISEFSPRLTKLFINSGSNINTEDDYGVSPLYLHLEQATINENLIKYYLLSGSKIKFEPKNKTTTQNQRTTAFQLFCQHPCNSIEIFKLFLQKKPKLNFVLRPRENALNLICGRANATLEILQLLKKEGAYFTTQEKRIFDDTLYIILGNEKCPKQKFEIIKYLINIGCDLSIENYYQGNALHFLCKKCNFPEFEECLIFFMKQLNISNISITNSFCDTPLHFLLKCYKSLSIPFLKTLFNEYHANFNLQNEQAKSPLYLYFANPNFNPKIMQFLIHKSKNAIKYLQNMQDKNTYLVHYICYSSNHPTVQKLEFLQNKCNMQLDLVSEYIADTALHTICGNRNIDKYLSIIKFLIKNGFEINQLNINNQTPLFVLVESIADNLHLLI